MLFRKCKKSIDEWIQNGTSALLVTGARQVGKTFIIEESLKDSQKEFFEFNLIEQENLCNIINDSLKNGVQDLINILSLESGKVIPQGSIIFIDEVQKGKDIVTMIKFFVKEGKYRFILSGSLLGVELSGLKSFPVGYLKTINMFPLDFEEFLIASGASISLLNQIKKSFDSKKSVPLTLHNKILSLFYRYLIVGGMPQVVSSFLLTNDLNVTYDIQQNIIQNYLMDFSQYEKSQRLKLMNLYKLIPSQLDDKNKRYQFNIINANIRFDRYEDSFNWLIDAGVALPTYNVTEITLPLIRSKKSNLFKLFLSDVGLLASMFGKSTILKLFNNDGSINNGAIFENFIACELICHHFPLYYANHKRYGEIDFLIEYQGELLPLEIKSGKDYKTHRALSNYLSLGFAKKGFVFSNYGEIEVINNITYYPIYMIMFLTNDIDLGIVEPVRFY